MPARKGGLDVDSVVTLNHIRSIDRQRLVRKLGALFDDTMKAVNRALRISLAIETGE